MSLASVREIAAIHEITDPWLRIRTYAAARDVGGLYPEGPYSFEAEVKVAPDEPLTSELGSAAAVREVQAHMVGRAKEALEALGAAGWHLAASWSIEMTARVTLVGPGKPPVQHDVGAVIRFTVDRERTEEEMAMHPETVAAKILNYSSY